MKQLLIGLTLILSIIFGALTPDVLAQDSTNPPEGLIGPLTQWPSAYDRLEATVYPLLSARAVATLETARAANRAAVDACLAPTPDSLVIGLVGRLYVYYIVDYWDNGAHWNDNKYIWSWNGTWYGVNPGCN